MQVSNVLNTVSGVVSGFQRGDHYYGMQNYANKSGLDDVIHVVPFNDTGDVAISILGGPDNSVAIHVAREYIAHSPTVSLARQIQRALEDKEQADVAMYDKPANLGRLIYRPRPNTYLSRDGALSILSV